MRAATTAAAAASRRPLAFIVALAMAKTVAKGMSCACVSICVCGIRAAVAAAIQLLEACEAREVRKATAQ